MEAASQDGLALNQNNDQKLVHIECGRATDPVSGIVFNFFPGSQRQLCKATWFAREEKVVKRIPHWFLL
jgi:hypothetical protein